MLKLKEEIKERGEDVVIYRHRSRLVFPIDTPEEDYPKWKNKGFNIFRCVECNSMNCSGCKVEEVYTEDISDDDQDYHNLTLKELRLIFPDIKAVSKKDFINQIEK